MNFIDAVKECEKGNGFILMEAGCTKYTPLIKDISSESWEVLE